MRELLLVNVDVLLLDAGIISQDVRHGNQSDNFSTFGHAEMARRFFFHQPHGLDHGITIFYGQERFSHAGFDRRARRVHTIDDDLATQFGFRDVSDEFLSAVH